MEVQLPGLWKIRPRAILELITSPLHARISLASRPQSRAARSRPPHEGPPARPRGRRLGQDPRHHAPHRAARRGGGGSARHRSRHFHQQGRAGDARARAEADRGQRSHRFRGYVPLVVAAVVAPERRRGEAASALCHRRLRRLSRAREGGHVGARPVRADASARLRPVADLAREECPGFGGEVRGEPDRLRGRANREGVPALREEARRRGGARFRRPHRRARCGCSPATRRSPPRSAAACATC